MARVELGTNDREFMKGRNDLVSQRRCPNEAEDRDDDEEQGIDRDEAVPSERNHELVRVVVTELLDDRVDETNRTVGTLPAIDARKQTVDPLHEQSYPCGVAARLAPVAPRVRLGLTRAQ